jgi:putative spermidine/putrescine transport system permease protein
LLTFVAPIVDMLFRSVENSIVEDTLPAPCSALRSGTRRPDNSRTKPCLRRWSTTSGIAVEGEDPHAARLPAELRTNRHVQPVPQDRSARQEDDEGPYKEQFIKVDKDWGDSRSGRLINGSRPPYTDGYFLAAVDAQRRRRHQDEAGDQADLPAPVRRTLFLSIVITVSCLLLGYPIAYLLASLAAADIEPSDDPRAAAVLDLAAGAHIGLEGAAAATRGDQRLSLVWIGIVSDANRLVMINNQTGTIIAMTHILLPFMILPLYSVMKTISPTYVRAAKSLGATNWTAFWRVYFPQSVPGIGAGAILVFILAIGYYITPELVGGTSGIFISNRIAYHISSR